MKLRKVHYRMIEHRKMFVCGDTLTFWYQPEEDDPFDNKMNRKRMLLDIWKSAYRYYYYGVDDDCHTTMGLGVSE
jgi:hypothetical protein